MTPLDQLGHKTSTQTVKQPLSISHTWEDITVLAIEKDKFSALLKRGLLYKGRKCFPCRVDPFQNGCAVKQLGITKVASLRKSARCFSPLLVNKKHGRRNVDPDQTM